MSAGFEKLSREFGQREESVSLERIKDFFYYYNFSNHCIIYLFCIFPAGT